MMASGLAHQLDSGGEGNVAGADALADHQLADFHREDFGNFIGQTLDLNFAGDQFVQAALQLDALRFADGVNGTFDAQAAGEIDALQVRCAAEISLMGSFCQSTIVTGVVSTPLMYQG